MMKRILFSVTLYLSALSLCFASGVSIPSNYNAASVAITGGFINGKAVTALGTTAEATAIAAGDATTKANAAQAAAISSAATDATTKANAAQAASAPITVYTTTTTPFAGAGVEVFASHSLGNTNFVAVLNLINITAECGWVTGETVQWSGTVSDGSIVSNIWKSPTQVGALNMTGSSNWLIRNKATGANCVPTPANWSYRFSLIR